MPPNSHTLACDSVRVTKALSAFTRFASSFLERIVGLTGLPSRKPHFLQHGEHVAVRQLVADQHDVDIAAGSIPALRDRPVHEGRLDLRLERSECFAQRIRKSR